MLRAKVLPEVLGQIIGDGIDATMYAPPSPSSPRSMLSAHARLMTLDGALMGSVGDVDVVDHKVVGAIASHTWGEYVHSGKEFNAGHALQTLLVELDVSAKVMLAPHDDISALTRMDDNVSDPFPIEQSGRLAMAAAGRGFVVCAYSSGDAEPGFIKAKVEALGSYLSTSLDQINV